MKETPTESLERLDLSEIREFLKTLVVEVAAILKKYQDERERIVVTKEGSGLIGITTQADVEVEDFLKEKLAKKLPGSQFLAEETPVDGYAKFRDVPLAWIIDPIDGTANFSRGDSYSISVALVSYGRSVLGVVHAPKEQMTYWAQADQPGAFCSGSGMGVGKIEVSQIDDVVKARVDTDVSSTNRSDNFSLLSRISPPIGQVLIRGTSVLALSKLAGQETDAFFHSDLKPWDVAAASLIAEKAGAIVTALDGTPLNMFQRHVTILAANPALHRHLVSLINETA